MNFKERIPYIIIITFFVCFSFSKLSAEHLPYKDIVEPVHVVAKVVSERPLKIRIITYPYKGMVLSLDSKETFDIGKLLFCKISSKGIKCKVFGVHK
ncbi:hypothetical protein [Desulfurobacterium indicum]|uniref:Uncharacterized protein n=1 Tax=Desulfurobacterium indicum TaxID=1914305 RepID=A0A1R1MN87_9BACT|nr:hypothetical protein [Desulfurobacterium indicum]OMH41237.1 hypothetical protein BLW93_00785 [Desulfurobacterium indicum]